MSPSSSTPRRAARTPAPTTGADARGARAVRRRGRTMPTENRLWAVPPRERVWWLAGDVVALLALAALTCLVWLPAFGTPWVLAAALGGAAIGCAVGIVAALRRWGALLTSVVAYLTMVLLGTPLATPGLGTAGVVPTGRSLLALAKAPVTVWRGLVTLEPPLGETGNLLAAPMMVGLVAALLGILVSTRSGHPRLAALPSLAALAVAASFGGARVVLPALVGAGFLVVALVWATWRHRQLSRVLVAGQGAIGWRPLLSGLGMVAVAGLCAALMAPVVAPGQRHHLREGVVPPLDPQQLASPLQHFRADVTTDKDLVLFKLTGMPAQARLRVATLDGYDGLTALVSNSNSDSVASDSGTFRRVGAQVPGVVGGTPATVGVHVEGYEGRWLPTVGMMKSFVAHGSRAGALTDSLYYNPTTGTSLVTEGLRKGDDYTLKVSVIAQPDKDDIRQARAQGLRLPTMDPIPALVRDYAVIWTKDATSAGDMALHLQDKLREGYYSNGGAQEQASLPGHNNARLATLLSPDRKMVGDEEQYAVTMALMARSLGLPSRVVYGYEPDARGGNVTVRGTQASVWVEIALEGYGWTVFTPCPPRDRKTTDNTIEQHNKPRPQVENPPPPPQRPEAVPPDGTTPLKPRANTDKGLDIPWETVGAVAVWVGLPLLVLVAPVALVLGIKARRRRSREFAPDPSARLAGGWAELVDRARDLGQTPLRGDTRTEQAAFLTDRFPKLGDVADPMALAREADAGVFAPGAVGEDAAADYWARTRGAVKGLGRGRSTWTRLRASLSLRSLRPWR